DADRVLAALNTARAAARARVWELSGAQAPNHETDASTPLIVDIDATLVTAHSEKEDAKPTYKKGFGFHPLLAFIDHGRPGCGEPVAGLLRPGNAGSNTAADHITLVKEVLAGLPGGKPRPGKSVLIRTDTAGGTHAFLNFLTKRRLSYSIGFMLPTTMPDLYRQLTKLKAWEPAYDTDGCPRKGADVAELTSVLDLDDWPDGMR
ncbi:transposase, partial [Brevibacterium sp. FAM 24630]|uniref:transposase n=1 Tax=Brevibacterium sp. FAM 24630 TaxID=3415680 RepID=UPI003C7EA9AD